MAAQLVSDFECTSCRSWERVRQGEQPVRQCCAAPTWRWRATRTYTPELVPNRFGTSAALDVHVSAERIAPVGAGIRVDSLRDIRRIERETEKMERDGVGQALRWRMYSQDGDAGRRVNSFGPPPSAAPSPEALRNGTVSVAPITEDPEQIALGPGVTPETQTDALAGVTEAP